MAAAMPVNDLNSDIQFKSQVQMSQISSIDNITQMNGFTYSCDANGKIIQKTIINGQLSQIDKTTVDASVAEQLKASTQNF